MTDVLSSFGSGSQVLPKLLTSQDRLNNAFDLFPGTTSKPKIDLGSGGWTSWYDSLTGQTTKINGQTISNFGLSDLNNAASPDGFWSNISNYFARTVVIILGMIFVAVGLSMFKRG